MSDQIQEFFADPIDLTAAPASYQVLPAMPARFRVHALEWEIKETVACSAGPTTGAGSNGPTYDNLAPAIARTAFMTQSAETRVIVSFAVPVPYVDLSASGLHVNITAPATATTLVARFIVLGSFLPL